MDPKNTTVCVTGATGYIGSRMCVELINRGYKVRAQVRSIADKSKGIDALQKLGENISFVEVADLENADFTEAFKGCKYVIHMASPLRPEPTNPDEVIKPTVEGVKNALRDALKTGVKRIVFTSSMVTICGSQREKNPEHVWSEADWNDNPSSSYSKAKTQAERYAWDFVKENPTLELVTIHPALVIGPITTPRADSSSVQNVITLISGKFKETGIPPAMFGLVDIRNVCEAHIKAMENEKANGQRYILCSKDQYSYFEVAQIIKKICPEFASKIPDHEMKPTNPKKGGTNNTKATEELGINWISPEVSFKDMVQSIVDAGLVQK